MLIIEKLKKPEKTKKLKKPPSYAKLKKGLDAAFSKWIRLRDSYICFTCGKRGDQASMQNGHYVSRVYLATRWDESNCHCQCVACNVFKHGNMTAYAARMISKYGSRKLFDLERQKHISTRHPRSWFLERIEYYKALVTGK